MHIYMMQRIFRALPNPLPSPLSESSKSSFVYRWRSDNTLAVASAFSDASMEAGEREVLLQRLLASLPDLDVTSLPALVHQIVLIGVKGDPKLAFEGLFNFLIECDRKASEQEADSK